MACNRSINNETTYSCHTSYEQVIPDGIRLGMDKKDFQSRMDLLQDSVSIFNYTFEIKPLFVCDTLNSLYFYHEYEGTDTIFKWETREINCRDKYLDFIIRTVLTCRFGKPHDLARQLIWEKGDTIIKMRYDDEDDLCVSKHLWYNIFTTRELLMISVNKGIKK